MIRSLTRWINNETWFITINEPHSIATSIHHFYKSNNELKTLDLTLTQVNTSTYSYVVPKNDYNFTDNFKVYSGSQLLVSIEGSDLPGTGSNQTQVHHEVPRHAIEDTQPFKKLYRSWYPTEWSDKSLFYFNAVIIQSEPYFKSAQSPLTITYSIPNNYELPGVQNPLTATTQEINDILMNPETLFMKGGTVRLNTETSKVHFLFSNRATTWQELYTQTTVYTETSYSTDDIPSFKTIHLEPTKQSELDFTQIIYSSSFIDPNSQQEVPSIFYSDIQNLESNDISLKISVLGSQTSTEDVFYNNGFLNSFIK
mgnify:FL=1